MTIGFYLIVQVRVQKKVLIFCGFWSYPRDSAKTSFDGRPWTYLGPSYGQQGLLGRLVLDRGAEPGWDKQAANKQRNLERHKKASRWSKEEAGIATLSRGLFFARGGKKPMLRDAAKLRAKFSHGHDQKHFQRQACPTPVQRGAVYWWLSGCTVAPSAFWKLRFLGHTVCVKLV